ncbi:MAG: hypothetical protein QHH75_10280 [Bacillota bacterium]|nr:hypothetical protein [Bacillota bacterium]
MGRSLKALKGSLGAPFFLAALIVLLTTKHGPLTLPGAAAAVAGAVFSLLGLNLPAAAAGTLSATISFTAQAMVGICPSCTLAAVFFALAGIVSSLRLVEDGRTAWAIVLALFLACSLSFFGFRLRPEPTEKTGGGLKAGLQPLAPVSSSMQGTKQVQAQEVPLLYYSPWCEYCDEPLRAFIEKDPEGRSWKPVVVPYSAISEGEMEAREIGYMGEVLSAPESPGRGLPCLRLPDGSAFVGKKKILDFLERSDPSSTYR